MPSQTNSSILKSWGHSVAIGLLGGLIVVFLGYEGLSLKKTATAARNRAETLDTFSLAIQRALPAIVSVTASRVTKPSRELTTVSWSEAVLPAPYTRATVSGSGVVVGPEGPVLTSRHLVQGATEISVCLNGSNQRFPAHVIGSDVATDLAVLSVDASDLPYLKFGDSSKIAVGDLTMAIGSPLAGRDSIAVGTISGTARNLDGEYSGFVQTLSRVKPSTEGGAIINQKGELIGINTLPLSSPAAHPIAIPSDLARKVMKQILYTERPPHQPHLHTRFMSVL